MFSRSLTFDDINGILHKPIGLVGLCDYGSITFSFRGDGIIDLVVESQPVLDVLVRSLELDLHPASEVPEISITEYFAASLDLTIYQAHGVLYSHLSIFIEAYLSELKGMRMVFVLIGGKMPKLRIIIQAPEAKAADWMKHLMSDHLT